MHYTTKTAELYSEISEIARDAAVQLLAEAVCKTARPCDRQKNTRDPQESRMFAMCARKRVTPLG